MSIIRSITFVGAAVLLMAVPARAIGPAGGSESYCIVRLTSLLDEESYEVMPQGKVNEMNQLFAAKQRVFPRALQEAEKEWNAQPGDKNAFPGRKLKAPQMRVMGTYSDEDKAWDRIKRYEDKEREQARQNQPSDWRVRRAVQDGRPLNALSPRANDSDRDKEADLKKAAEMVELKLDALASVEPAAAGPMIPTLPSVPSTRWSSTPPALPPPSWAPRQPKPAPQAPPPDPEPQDPLPGGDALDRAL